MLSCLKTKKTFHPTRWSPWRGRKSNPVVSVCFKSVLLLILLLMIMLSIYRLAVSEEFYVSCTRPCWVIKPLSRHLTGHSRTVCLWQMTTALLKELAVRCISCCWWFLRKRVVGAGGTRDLMLWGSRPTETGFSFQSYPFIFLISLEASWPLWVEWVWDSSISVRFIIL